LEPTLNSGLVKDGLLSKCFQAVTMMSNRWFFVVGFVGACPISISSHCQSRISLYLECANDYRHGLTWVHPLYIPRVPSKVG
jgi:hypothetical protein